MTAQSRRFAVMEINGIAQNLINLMDFVVDNNPPCGLKKLSRLTAMAMLHKMTVAAVNWRCAHNPYGDYETSLMEHLFGAQATYTAEQYAVYRALSNDPLWCGITQDIERQVSEHIEVDTYKDWRVIKVGTLIGLAEGQDYRITEYYRLHPDQKEDEEAVITLDASNPVNYLLGQFKHEFGTKLEKLIHDDFSMLSTYHSSNQLICHQDIFTQERMRSIQSHNRSMITSNPMVAHQALMDIYNDTTGYVASMFVDTLVSMYPMVELAYNAPRFNTTGLLHLGIWNMDKFRSEYLQKVISAFGLSYFSAYLKKDKKYVLEYSRNNVLAIYEKPPEKPSDKEQTELLRSFMAGDRLPHEQQRLAQALYEEASRSGVLV